MWCILHLQEDYIYGQNVQDLKHVIISYFLFCLAYPFWQGFHGSRASCELAIRLFDAFVEIGGLWMGWKWDKKMMLWHVGCKVEVKVTNK